MNTLEHEEHYICECGKEFTNSQSFNGHKSNCKVHIESKGKYTWEEHLDKQHKALQIGLESLREKRKKKSEDKYISSKLLWESTTHYCERCGVELPHNYEDRFGSGRFCSRACSNSHEQTDEINKKRSNTLKDKYKDTVEVKYCKVCGKKLSKNNQNGLCINCLRNTEEGKALMSKFSSIGAQNAKDKGTAVYWQSRNIQSYPEKFWENVLRNNNITYEGPNKPVRKSDGKNNYFLDFYIEKNGKKVDLEIDGKQHTYDDRAKSDIIRDEYLSSLGYIIYRVPWNEINTESGSLQMKNKIDEFIEYYNNL